VDAGGAFAGKPLVWRAATQADFNRKIFDMACGGWARQPWACYFDCLNPSFWYKRGQRAHSCSMHPRLSQAVFFSADYKSVPIWFFLGFLRCNLRAQMLVAAILIFRGSPPLGCCLPKNVF
jgi:hypothetical protein